jgi:hypothetical protein
MDNRKITAGSKMISTTTRTAVAVIKSAPTPQICGCGFGYPWISMGMPQSTGDNTSDDEGQLPPEHYLAQAESLNVSQLWQQQYNDGTQEKLDETRMYWNR